MVPSLDAGLSLLSRAIVVIASSPRLLSSASIFLALKDAISEGSMNASYTASSLSKNSSESGSNEFQ
jgi:hypothetical protein